MNYIKFCVTCKHVIPEINAFYIFGGSNKEFSRCALFPKKIESVKHQYLVTGESKSRQIGYNYCYDARKYDTMCGEKGTYYEKK